MKNARVFTAIIGLGILLLCSLSVQAADRVQVMDTPEGGRPVVARTGRDGVTHLLFDAPDGPRYARSHRGTTSFGPSIPILIEPPVVKGLEYSAWDMAVGQGGRVHVALGTNAWKLKLPHEEWGLFHASIDPGANAFSPLRNINHKPSEGFSLAADANGRVTACWLADRLYANVSRDNGETFAPAVEINPKYNPCNCCTTSCAYGEDGRLAVLYREETNNDRDMHLVLWDQDRGETTRQRISKLSWKIDACPMTYYTVVPRSGGFLAAWPTKGEVFFTALNGSGNPGFSDEIATPGRSGMRTGIVALGGPDGSTLVAWKRADQLGWQLYDDKGRAVGPVGSTPSLGNGAAGVVTADGGFLLFR